MTKGDVVICYYTFDLVELCQMRSVGRLIPMSAQPCLSLQCPKCCYWYAPHSPEDPVDRVELGRLETAWLVCDLVQHGRGNSSRVRP
jgi:hypothetical protein